MAPTHRTMSDLAPDVPAEPPASRLVSPDPSDVISVLVDAFRDYPVMRFVLGGPVGPAGSNALDEARLSRLIQLFVMARVYRGEPIFGVRVRDRLAGVALVSDPAGSKPPAEFLRLREEVWSDLGEESRERYEAFGKACQPLLVESPHLHLNMIGVRREVQGSGLSTALLSAVHDMADRTDGCMGVTLTTESPGNLSFYSRFGYQVTGHARVGEGLETWAHFRPVRKRTDETDIPRNDS